MIKIHWIIKLRWFMIRVQAAMDVAEAVYFIHNLSNPVVHQVMVDDE